MEHRYPTTGRLLMLANAEAKKEAAKAASMCEERLRFDPVPVYDVTLGEDISAPASGTHYIITASDLGGDYRVLWVVIAMEAAEDASNNATSIECIVYSGENYRRLGIGNAIFKNQNRKSVVSICGEHGAIGVYGGNYSTGTTLPWVFAGGDTPIFTDGYVSKIELFHYSGAYFPAGSEITVYAAFPDQRVTDVFGTELEEVTSEQIHSLFV